MSKRERKRQRKSVINKSSAASDLNLRKTKGANFSFRSIDALIENIQLINKQQLRNYRAKTF